jgi:hypothetical protein
MDPWNVCMYVCMYEETVLFSTLLDFSETRDYVSMFCHLLHNSENTMAEHEQAHSSVLKLLRHTQRNTNK